MMANRFVLQDEDIVFIPDEKINVKEKSNDSTTTRKTK